MTAPTTPRIIRTTAASGSPSPFLTLLEWKCASFFGIHGLALWVSLAVMAVVKALMVAFYFMHLAFEKKLIHALLTIPILLVIIMMLLVIPDSRQYILDYLQFN